MSPGAGVACICLYSDVLRYPSRPLPSALPIIAQIVNTQNGRPVDELERRIHRRHLRALGEYEDVSDVRWGNQPHVRASPKMREFTCRWCILAITPDAKR